MTVPGHSVGRNRASMYHRFSGSVMPLRGTITRDNGTRAVGPRQPFLCDCDERIAPMLDYLLHAGVTDLSTGAVIVAVVVLILGLVALLRCDTKDIPAIVQAIASCWRR
jgi:hypothetical protein